MELLIYTCNIATLQSIAEMCDACNFGLVIEGGVVTAVETY